MSPLIWLLIALVLAIIEILVVDLTFIMLAGGALSASAVSWLFSSENLYLQAGVFIVVSVVLLFAVKPWAKAHISRHTPNISTNSDALIGRAVRVTEPVGANSGYVSVGGQIWSARTDVVSGIPAGSTAYITRIDGATAIVSDVPTPKNPSYS